MTPSVTEDQVILQVRAFLLAVLPGGVEVVAGQTNRTPEPAAADYVVFWSLLRQRLSTNVDTWATSTIKAQRSTRFDMQLDVHGPNGGDNAQVITTLWRDDYACRFMDVAIVSPLYASDGHQAPFINGEAQYENRWTLTLTMQVKPSVDVTAQYMDEITLSLREADSPALV